MEDGFTDRTGGDIVGTLQFGAHASGLYQTLRFLQYVIVPAILQKYLTLRYFYSNRIHSRTNVVLLAESSNAGERACSHSIDVLSRLYDNIRQLELCGDIQASMMFQRLLQQAIKPFLLNMERWLSGQPLDSESEFMIKLYVTHSFHSQQ